MSSRSTHPPKHRSFWVHDTLSRVILASILIFAGLVFFAEMMGYLPQIAGTSEWHWVMLGVGGLLVLEGIIRALSVDQAEPHMMKLIGGVLLIGFGAARIFSLEFSGNWWPIILIIAGISALARGIRH